MHLCQQCRSVKNQTAVLCAVSFKCWVRITKESLCHSTDIDNPPHRDNESAEETVRISINTPSEETVRISINTPRESARQHGHSSRTAWGVARGSDKKCVALTNCVNAVSIVIFVENERFCSVLFRNIMCVSIVTLLFRPQNIVICV